jgi:phage tail sheath gpL-like
MGAVPSSAVSAVVGYSLTEGNFANASPNLPQSIAVLAEANDANQSTMPAVGTPITSAQQAGNLYGFGSPIYHIARILFPNNGGGGGGVSGIPVTVFAQPAAANSTPSIIEITPVGVANNNGTHYVKISGREGLDGQYYAINFNAGDTTHQIAGYIQNAVNAVLGAPVIASSSPYYAALQTKWSGLTANELNISIDTNGNSCGLSYAISQIQTGSGTPSIASALNSFGNAWYTIVINGYSTQAQILSALENFNGVPATINNPTPTGRYVGITFKPFVAFTGSTADNPTTINTVFTAARTNQCTIALCVAPSSPGFSFEAAANYAVLSAVQEQNDPNLDIQYSFLPDMPVPLQWTASNAMSAWAARDAIVKLGCSTADVEAGQYKVNDFVTTYCPTGELIPQFRYVRNLMLDFNVQFGYNIIVIQNVQSHSIANDYDVVNAAKVIKPKQLKQLIASYALDLATRGLIVDAVFMVSSITVNIDTANPDRLDVFFRYKRAGFGRIVDTTAQAGFNYGNVTN